MIVKKSIAYKRKPQIIIIMPSQSGLSSHLNSKGDQHEKCSVIRKRIMLHHL